MADKPKPAPATLMGDFGWLIWGLVGIGIIWFLTGGAYSQSARGGAYLKPPAPLDTGEVYGTYYEGTPKSNDDTKLDLPRKPGEIIRKLTSGLLDLMKESETPEKINSSSPLSKSIRFDGVAGANESAVINEYIRIVSSDHAEAGVKISGLKLEGRSFESTVTIPQAVQLPVIGENSPKTDILLLPEGRALISTSKSPIGTSFRVNMCTGYLDQFQDYTPDLRKDCPSPEAELKKTELTGEKACVDFVRSLPRCRVYQGDLPSTISSACKVFVTEKLNYNSCVANYKKDTGFYTNEWRIFLDRNKEIWAQESETIKLLDSKEQIVDTITY